MLTFFSSCCLTHFIGPLSCLLCVAVEEFYVHKNRLDGSMPSEMGNMQSLRNFRAHTNGMVGSIPSELANAWKLDALLIQDNRLTGTIPRQFGSLNKLGK